MSAIYEFPWAGGEFWLWKAGMTDCCCVGAEKRTPLRELGVELEEVTVVSDG
ncbi:MAG: hypothetical protein OSA89_09710 [Mariniblastus sp.]|nr:hypothetical protein [Mariniblastus sp.]